MDTASNFRLGAGRVITRGDAGWDEARTPWQLAVDQQPAAIALPRTPDEVATAVLDARERGLRVAPQATGHNANPLAPLDGSLLVRTERLSGLRIDPQRRIARVGAGVLWDPVMVAAAEHGLTALAGSSPDVGVVGYSLGGGIGWLARRHGMQTNRITAVELVTPDGERVRADDEHDTDLFWALRGGGGNFGVVTALEFELLSVGPLYGGALVWDWRNAGPVLRRWSEWTATAPDLITSSARIMQFPPVEEVPAPLRGRRVVMIDGAYEGTGDEAASVLRPLRALRPDMDTFASIPPAALVRLHGDPEGPHAFVSDHRILSGLPPDAVEAFVELAGHGSDSPLMIAEFRHLGGALARRPERHGVLPRIEGAYSLLAGAPPQDPEHALDIVAYVQRLGAALAPWDTGRSYLNMAEQPIDVRTAFGAAEYWQLQRIRARIDPDGVMHANHPITD
jgi:FAD/FMN-containing dehydrogenase